MLRTFFTLILAFALILHSQAQPRPEVVEYINKHKSLAIKEMQRSGVPASITMAQAILESASGASRLAQLANNHFGIKCQVEWTGESISHDDDAPGECFRKYNSIEASFYDHSEFLTTRSRYAFLFDYPITDYKSWAHGLKTAGYATNPQYGNKLVELIETYALHQLDTETPVAISVASVASVTTAAQQPTGGMMIDLVDPESPYPLEKINGLLAVRAREGDNFAKIASALRKKTHILARYNELPYDTNLREGQVVYLRKKRNKARGEEINHTVRPGDTMHEISQRYAIQVNALYKLNRMASTYLIKVGERILLQ